MADPLPSRLRRAGRLAACLVLLAAGSPAAAQFRYGEIELLVEPTPMPNEVFHGYNEYRFQIRNHSTERPRAVRVSLPASRFGGESGLTSVTREVVVSPGSTRVLSLLQPSQPEMSGGDASIHLDGRLQEVPIRLTLAPSHNYGYHGRRHRGYHRAPRASVGPSGDTVTLTSQRIGENFFRNPAGGFGMGAPGGMGGGAGMPGMPGMPGGVAHYLTGQILRSAVPISSWSGNWLAYTRYDCLVLAKEDLDELQKAQASPNVQDVQQALWRYVEAGGVLLVVNPDPTGRQGQARPAAAPVGMPESWTRTRTEEYGFGVYRVGFGRCWVSPHRNPIGWDSMVWAPLNAQIRESAAPWRSQPNLVSLNTGFPVVDDLSVPVGGLFFLMIVFALAIGPANLWMLTYRNRRIWLLWTVPVLSAVFCLAVLGYMVVSEGWTGHARVAGLTLLDENAGRATTLGNCAFYSPMTPGDGLRFSTDTEVQIQGQEHSAYNGACSLEWLEEKQEQHLSRGWVTARVPSHFVLRRSDPTRTVRVTTRREDDGGLSVRNDLGVNVGGFWLADEKGQIYQGSELVAGEWTRLKPAPGQAGKDWADRLRARFVEGNGNWSQAIRTMAASPQDCLGPGTYLAVLETSPFLDQPLRGAAVRPSQSLVLGLLKK